MRRANTAKDKPETTMTRFFIAGIAALFLATGTPPERARSTHHANPNVHVNIQASTTNTICVSSAPVMLRPFPKTSTRNVSSFIECSECRRQNEHPRHPPKKHSLSVVIARVTHSPERTSQIND